jgi:hypothetical protein
MSTVVVSWCRSRHICLWCSSYMGSSYGDFFSDCALMCGSRSQITVLEAWGPRLGGGGIGYHGLSCHGKVYEDECRIASCEVSPCEARR